MVSGGLLCVLYACDETVTETVKCVQSEERQRSGGSSEADFTSTAELTSKSCLQFS